MKRTLVALALLGLLAALLAAQPPNPIDPTPRRPPDPTPAGKAARAPRLLALKLHADWCPTCKTMGTMFEDLGKKFDAEPVLFVKLDLTEQRCRTQGEYMIAALGLGKLWQEFGEGKQTGVIKLVDAATRKVVQSIPGDAGWEKAEKMLADALKK